MKPISNVEIKSPGQGSPLFLLQLLLLLLAVAAAVVPDSVAVVAVLL